jgi:hypothetical protein
MLNRRALERANADSGAFEALETYGHRFTQAGRFRIDVREDDLVVARHSLEVVDDRSATPQVRIDVGRSAGRPKKDCGCADLGSREPLAAGGAALWWTSGNEQRMSIAGVRIEPGGDRESFDSRELGEGDFFSRVFLRPGTYRLINQLSRAEGRITVTSPRRAGGPDRNPSIAQSAVRVLCRERGFDPAEIELERGQGVVWFVVESALYRIVVEPTAGAGT